MATPIPEDETVSLSRAEFQALIKRGQRINTGVSWAATLALAFTLTATAIALSFSAEYKSVGGVTEQRITWKGWDAIPVQAFIGGLPALGVTTLLIWRLRNESAEAIATTLSKGPNLFLGSGEEKS